MRELQHIEFIGHDRQTILIPIIGAYTFKPTGNFQFLQRWAWKFLMRCKVLEPYYRPDVKITRIKNLVILSEDELNEKLKAVAGEIILGLGTDGVHHKQFHLENALRHLWGDNLYEQAKQEFDWIEGIPS